LACQRLAAVRLLCGGGVFDGNFFFWMSEMITESDLYAMAMESDTAYRLMEHLCAQLGMHYPPQQAPINLSILILNSLKAKNVQELTH